MRDNNEIKIMKKLALEYKEMVSTVAVQEERREILRQKMREKRFQYKDRTDLNVQMRAEMINRKYFRI